MPFPRACELTCPSSSLPHPPQDHRDATHQEARHQAAHRSGRHDVGRPAQARRRCVERWRTGSCAFPFPHRQAFPRSCTADLPPGYSSPASPQAAPTTCAPRSARSASSPTSLCASPPLLTPDDRLELTCGAPTPPLLAPSSQRRQPHVPPVHLAAAVRRVRQGHRRGGRQNCRDGRRARRDPGHQVLQATRPHRHPQVHEHPSRPGRREGRRRLPLDRRLRVRRSPGRGRHRRLAPRASLSLSSLSPSC